MAAGTSSLFGIVMCKCNRRSLEGLMIWHWDKFVATHGSHKIFLA